MNRPSVLVVTGEVLGPRLAGPGIRASELARVLAGAGYPCTLAGARVEAGGEFPVPVVATGTAAFDQALSAAATLLVSGSGYDSVATRRPGQRLVLDLICPEYFESLACNPVAESDPRRTEKRFHLELHHRKKRRELLARLAAADFVIVGSEPQRDLLIGILTVLGKVHPGRGEVVPETYVGLVPPGIAIGAPEVRPVSFPGCAPGDRVFLWWGCACDWYDYGTLFKAMERIAAQRPEIKLVLGALHIPGRAAPPGAEVARWLDWARARGLLGTAIQTLPEWVPYAERGAYLAAATAGVYCHRRTLETRYAVRTRFYDYLWASLPMVISAGDGFESLVRERGVPPGTAACRVGRDDQERGFGMVVDEGDVDGWVAALETMAGDPARREAMRRNLAAARGEFTWERSARPLLEWLDRPAPARPSLDPARYLEYLGERTAAAWREDGARGVAGKLRRYLGKLAE